MRLDDPSSRLLLACTTLSDPNCRLFWPLRHVGVQLMVGRGPHRNFEAGIHAEADNFIDEVDKLLSAEITRRGDNSEIGNQPETALNENEIAVATTHLLGSRELRRSDFATSCLGNTADSMHSIYAQQISTMVLCVDEASDVCRPQKVCI